MNPKPRLRPSVCREELARDLLGPVVYAAVAPMTAGCKFVKVGYSEGLLSRMRSVQTGCPVPIAEVSYVRVFSADQARNIESAIHLLMAEFRSSGEWFKFDLSSPRDLKAWRSAIPAVLNEAVGKGRWNLKTFNYSKAVGIRRAA